VKTKNKNTRMAVPNHNMDRPTDRNGEVLRTGYKYHGFFTTAGKRRSFHEAEACLRYYYNLYYISQKNNETINQFDMILPVILVAGTIMPCCCCKRCTDLLCAPKDKATSVNGKKDFIHIGFESLWVGRVGGEPHGGDKR
jgi:hypothetical protein